MSSNLSGASLSEIGRLVEACKNCELWRSRTRAVPGSGDPEARLLFVGEAPGYHEDRQGLPFVGAAGQLLDSLLARIGLDRSEVFVTNILKCRPPGNRDPLPTEMEACRGFLDRQVELINPVVIATLGRYSMVHFLGAQESISQAHGRPHRVGGRIVFPLFHPAAALRQERFKVALEADFLRLAELLATSEVVAAPADDQGPPQQLSLF